ncbi:uncharacterized protein LOC117160065 isoform X2 [Bombus vancouverensis nearcticus]|uniref:uncharacterized protein LOC117160065 isoform X2 n=1 Tax=Bombus vancouverensis nearcticus TaxID=2705178 RepID=UPI00402BC6FE
MFRVLSRIKHSIRICYATSPRKLVERPSFRTKQLSSTSNKTNKLCVSRVLPELRGGKRADLSDWFVKQENEYEEPQTLFEFVASSYDLAERKKAAKSVICEECGKSFSRLDSLRRHEKNYCRVKGDRMYCRFCGKKFAKPLSLISHVKSAHSTLFLKSQTS